ncbi:MAG: DUF2927 domain-containing protein [Pseudomonadota bacterium]
MGRRGVLLAGLLTGLLSGCDLFAPERFEPPPPPPRPAPEIPPRSPESLALERYYTKVEASLLSQEFLRTDRGGVDAPWDADDLTRNFIQIATFDEYDALGEVIIKQETASQIRRWEMPVRVALEFGETVSPVKRLEDTDAVRRLTGRLATATGHPISFVSGPGNFTVFVVNQDELRALGPRLLELLPRLTEGEVQAITTLPRTTYCAVLATAPVNTGTYNGAVAVVRGEHPDMLRLSCLHEEIAQGLGLANDSPAARPSIFNDSEEFALLTEQDEAMLTILYDDRLRPGMTAAQAAPIVEKIAAEITGEPSRGPS